MKISRGAFSKRACGLLDADTTNFIEQETRAKRARRKYCASAASEEKFEAEGGDNGGSEVAVRERSERRNFTRNSAISRVISRLYRPDRPTDIAILNVESMPHVGPYQ